MRLLHFEPLLWTDLVDYPDLGSAMLMGVYKAKGVHSKLVCTQLQYIEAMLLDYANELECLFKQKYFSQSNEYILLNSIKTSFNETFSELYNMFYSKQWGCYLNAGLTEKFKQLFIEITKLQFEYIESGNLSVPIIHFFKEIINKNPSDIICLSLYEYNRYNRLLLKFIREFTKAKIVLGGAFTGHLNKIEISSIISEGYVDFLIIGAGEFALPKLLDYILNKEELPKNVIASSDPLKLCCIEEKVINNLQDLPLPDFSQSKLDKYPSPLPILPLQTARGCTWRKCTFCAHHSGYFGEYHTFPLEKIVNLIAELSRVYGCNHFVLHDDEIPVLRLKKLGELLNNRGVNVNISAYVRADKYFLQHNILETLFKYGIKGLSWGIESGSQRVLNSIKKGIDVEQVKLILKRSYESGIVNTCWMMFNLPDETIDDFTQSLQLMTDLSKYVDLWLISPFRMQADSPMYKSMRKVLKSKRLFCTSIEQTNEEIFREKQWTEKIDTIYSNGLLNNDRCLYDIPSGCQRARLISFMYLTSLKDKSEYSKFQVLINNKTNILSLGSKSIMIRGGDKIELNNDELKILMSLKSKSNPRNVLHNSEMLFLKKLEKLDMVSLMGSL